MDIKPLVPNSENMSSLVDESTKAGLTSVSKLIAEYESGINRFNFRGEFFVGVFCCNDLVGVGGLNIEPYEPESAAGRLRRFYVLEKWRRRGVGSALLKAIESHASHYFPTIQLYTPSAAAAAFYEASGYERRNRIKVSHAKTLVV